ncbi:transcriptional regulator with XRE-family HTH domain [Staphylococcus caledonicus]
METKKDHLGLIIKKLRKYKNMTQSQLSDATGFSQNTISNHENGKRKVGFNEVETYSKGLAIPSYLILKINQELNDNGSSYTLNEFPTFHKIYNDVNYAYYHESDIYYTSNDRFDETVELINLMKKANVNIKNVSYDYILDLYKQLLSDGSDYSIMTYGTVDEQNELRNKNKVSNEEILSFHTRYIELMAKTMNGEANNDEIIDETYELEKEAINLGEKLKLVPNYHYDVIKGEPIYKTFLYKYPERLEEHRNFIKNRQNEE